MENDIPTKTLLSGNIYQAVNDMLNYINQLEQANIALQEQIKPEKTPDTKD